MELKDAQKIAYNSDGYDTKIVNAALETIFFLNELERTAMWFAFKWLSRELIRRHVLEQSNFGSIILHFERTMPNVATDPENHECYSHEEIIKQFDAWLEANEYAIYGPAGIVSIKDPDGN